MLQEERDNSEKYGLRNQFNCIVQPKEEGKHLGTANKIFCFSVIFSNLLELMKKRDMKITKASMSKCKLPL